MRGLLSALSGLSPSDWLAAGALLVAVAALLHSIRTARRQRPLLELQKRLAELQVAEQEEAAAVKADRREAMQNARWLVQSFKDETPEG